MSEEKGNPDFWVAIATISPVVLVAFAATMPDLLTENRRRRVAEAQKRGNKFLSIYIPGWVLGIPALGGLMTGWAAYMLTLHSEHRVLEYCAVGGVVVLMVGLFSAGVQLWRMTRDSPNQRDLLQQILVTLRQTQANESRAPDEA